MDHPQDVPDLKSHDRVQENQKHYRACDLDRVDLDPKEKIGFPLHKSSMHVIGRPFFFFFSSFWGDVLWLSVTSLLFIKRPDRV